MLSLFQPLTLENAHDHPIASLESKHTRGYISGLLSDKFNSLLLETAFQMTKPLPPPQELRVSYYLENGCPARSLTEDASHPIISEVSLRG